MLNWENNFIISFILNFEIEVAFAEAEVFRGDFQEFVVGEEGEVLFEAHVDRRCKFNDIISGGGTHVGEFFTFADVHVDIVDP